MTKETTNSGVLERLLAGNHLEIDPIRLASEALERGDTDALRLLMAGVQLQREAVKEVQRLGIRKAQEVVSKYPGRKPAAFGFSDAKRAKLANMLKFRLDASTFDDAPPEANISLIARELKCSRATLYRYIKATPALLATVELLRKRKGQLTRKDSERASKTERKATKVFTQGLKDAGLSRQDRPILDAARQERQVRQDVDETFWALKRAEQADRNN